MMIARAVFDEKPLIIPRCHDCAVLEFNEADDPFVTRMLDADSPCRAIQPRPDGANIAARVNQRMARVTRGQHAESPVNRIPFRDAADIGRHLRLRQPHAARVAGVEFSEIHTPQRPANFFRRRNALVFGLNSPQINQRADGHVEQAVCKNAVIFCAPQQAARFLVNRRRRDSSVFIDASNLACVSIPAECVFNTLDFRIRGGDGVLRLLRIGGNHLHVNHGIQQDSRLAIDRKRRRRPAMIIGGCSRNAQQERKHHAPKLSFSHNILHPKSPR